MNAITMKLESKQLPVPSAKEKTKASLLGKKCKKNRKKSIPANTDKDAVHKNHGLGRKSSDSFNQTDTNSDTIFKYDLNLDLISSKKVGAKKSNSKTTNDKMPPKSEKMQERLEQFLSPGVKEKISSILNDVKSLSDVEKLYLYLQLPTGASLEVDPLKPKGQNPLGKKADEEGMIAVTWIQSHFEEDPEVSLPKQEVYNEYQSYCQMTKTDSLCAADFGKVMKQIFPSVKPRRLGTRGNSRYCYSGLRKKVKLKSPQLPDTLAEVENSNLIEESSKDETTSAACHILFQWAEKLLGFKFTSLKSLASHLLENMYVDQRSVAAFTVLLESSPQALEKGFSNCEGVKKTDAQMHLQRKIQEKELIKEQKKKMQEQRSSIAVLNKSKASNPKKKPGKSKKSKSILNADITDSVKKDDYLIPKNNESSSEGTLLQENLSFEIKEEDSESISILPHESPSIELIVEQSCRVTSPLPSPATIPTDIEESSKKSSYLLSPTATPVCIAPNLPGIIIVPSNLPPLAEIGIQSPGTPKYKRIQPKPFREGLSSAMRSRAGSVGSTIASKAKANDGRRSSHAWLQSTGSPEAGEDKNVKIASLKTTPQKSAGSRKNSFVLPKDMGAALDTSGLDAVSPQLTGAAAVEIMANLSPGQVSSKSISELMLKPNLASNCIDSALPSEENSAVKRQIDESAGQSASKRPHMDSGQNLGSLLGWSKEICATNNLLGPSSQNTSMQPSSGTSEEEVSVLEIEGDALVDYMRGTHSNTVFSSIPAIKDNLNSDKHLSTASKNQLSQLRMLLEQNLPRRIGNSSVSSSKEETKSNTIVDLNSYSFPKPVNTEVFNGKRVLFPNLSNMTDQMNFTSACNPDVFSNSISDEKFNSNNSQTSSIEKYLSLELSIQDDIGDQNNLLSDPSIFLNSAKNDLSKMDVSLNSGISDLKQNVDASNFLLNSNVIPDTVERPSQINNSLLSGRVNTYTQVPSVPQSPNTRRRNFNFTPISPRNTPIPEGLNASGTSNISSPILTQYPRNTMSIGVGPSQPPSNAGSPFVSPRSTPVSMCRSRHSSDQSTYSTSRHTPFQNFDSGVSSVSSSPFISPQPTPIPVSRLRHNSSHGTGKTVTFSAVNNPQILNSMGPLRSRHSSGPGGPLCHPLSPLVSECPPSSFAFPSSEARSRHGSGSATMSPVSSEQSSSSCTSNLPDLTSVAEAGSFLTDGGGDLLIGGNPANIRQARQRHASSSVIYSKPHLLAAASLERGGANRSQSVPLHQMLHLDSMYLTDEARPMFSFPPLMDGLSSDHLLGRDKSLAASPQMEWAGLEAGEGRRNLSSLLEPPLSDDLQTTLEDLRDCDTDFSKFAQELELSQNDGGLQYDVK